MAPKNSEDHAFGLFGADPAGGPRAYAGNSAAPMAWCCRCHVGLHAGDVVIRPLPHSLPMQYAALGLTTDLAVCVAQRHLGHDSARPRPWTWSQDWCRSGCRPLPIQALAASVEVCALLGTSGRRRRLQTARARGLTCFVGRQIELGLLQEALAQAAVGHGQVVAVVGEAGVGKSRLVDECVAAAGPQGWMVLDSAAVSYRQATPYGPVIDLLQRYCAVNDRDDPQTVRAKVTGQVLALHATLQDILPALLALLGLCRLTARSCGSSRPQRDSAPWRLSACCSRQPVSHSSWSSRTCTGWMRKPGGAHQPGRAPQRILVLVTIGPLPALGARPIIASCGWIRWHQQARRRCSRPLWAMTPA